MDNKDQVISNIEDENISKLFEISKYIIKEVFSLNGEQTEKFANSMQSYKSEIYDIFDNVSEEKIEDIAKIVAVKSINYLFRNMSKIYDMTEKIKQEKETYDGTRLIANIIIDTYNNFKLEK